MSTIVVICQRADIQTQIKSYPSPQKRHATTTLVLPMRKETKPATQWRPTTDKRADTIELQIGAMRTRYYIKSYKHKNNFDNEKKYSINAYPSNAATKAKPFVAMPNAPRKAANDAASVAV